MCVCTCDEQSFVPTKSGAEQLFKRTLISKSGNSQEKKSRNKERKMVINEASVEEQEKGYTRS